MKDLYKNMKGELPDGFFELCENLDALMEERNNSDGDICEFIDKLEKCCYEYLALIFVLKRQSL